MTLCPEMQTETKPLSVSERPETPKQKVMVAPNKTVYLPVMIILVALSADCILPAVKNCTSIICLSDLRVGAPLQHMQDIKEGTL